MGIFRLFLCSLVCCARILAADGSSTVSFDDQEPGRSPSGWNLDLTGSGVFTCTVERDKSAPSQPLALRISGQVSRDSFPMCIRKEAALKDGFVEVKFKAESGKTDQAAGVVWRHLDSRNCYICRANALENNVVLYKVENGKRKALDIAGRKGGYGTDAPVAPLRWHTLKVEFSETRFIVLFNGRPLFEVEDATFSEPGGVGVWTKADSVTLFDDFRYGEKQ
jgi:hypothetical protein